MESTELKQRLQRMGVKPNEFAREADLYLPDVYAILANGAKFGPVKRARIEAALERLEQQHGARKV